VARLLKDMSPHYRASPGMVWPKAQAVDGPHGAQRGAAGGTGDWTTSGKVFTGCFHGPRHTRLTRLRAPTRSEEGRRRRCGAHRRGRRRRSSMAVQVSVLRVEAQRGSNSLGTA
jgi:hypothetical protein